MIGDLRELSFNVADAPVAAFCGIRQPSVACNVFAFLTNDPNVSVAPIHPIAMSVIPHPEDS